MPLILSLFPALNSSIDVSVPDLQSWNPFGSRAELSYFGLARSYMEEAPNFRPDELDLKKKIVWKLPGNNLVLII